MTSTDILVPQNWLRNSRAGWPSSSTMTRAFSVEQPQYAASVERRTSLTSAGAAITVSDFDQAVAFTAFVAICFLTPTGVTAVAARGATFRSFV